MVNTNLYKNSESSHVSQREELESNLVYGDRECGLHFGINLLRGEVAGQESGTQHTVKTAAAGQRLHCLLRGEAGQREGYKMRLVNVQHLLMIFISQRQANLPAVLRKNKYM